MTHAPRVLPVYTIEVRKFTKLSIPTNGRNNRDLLAIKKLISN